MSFMRFLSLRRGMRRRDRGGAQAEAEFVQRKSPKSLSELCADLYSLVYSLRMARDLGDPDEIRKKINSLLERLVREGEETGFSQQAIQESRFAVVSLLDETILTSQWSGRDSWFKNPLQMEHFGINKAGEVFFDRLARLREDVGQNRAALEVYYDVLAMGFEGKYKLFGPEKVEALLEELSRDLTGGSAFQVEDLSPAWKRPDDFPELVGEGIPIWVTTLVFVPVMALLVGAFSWMAHLAAKGKADVIEQLFSGLR
jgi:type VI secretion system protein ImpK